MDFLKIAEKYRVVFFDAYGVLKSSSGILAGLQATLDGLQERGIEFYILSNDASRSPQEMAAAYSLHGIEQLGEERNISSGIMARDFLQAKVKQGKVAYLGKPNSAYYIESAGLEAVPISEIDIHQADGIKALVFLDDDGFDWYQDLNKALNLLLRKNMPAIVANSDHSYPASLDESAIAIGSLAEMVEKIVGKNFIFFGKPDSQIFSYGFELAKQNLKDLQKQDILMVGDTLTTDIIGGNKFGIDTMLVLSGNTLPQKARLQIKTTGIIPTHICTSIVS
ncbi:MAG: HAD-IIA family hydrolase [Spirochaetota bacterium]